MGISLRDFVLGRHMDRLTHRQQAVQYGVTSLVVIAVVVVLRWLADVLLGWDVDFEQMVAIAGGMLAGAVIVTVFRLVRDPRSGGEPDFHLTDGMSRRVR